MTSNELLELTIEKLVYGGEGLARHNGKVFFVPLVLPGERITAEVTEQRSDFGRARLIEVLEPSPDRVLAPCPYFGRCGGCQWQHIEKSAQDRLRIEILSELLKRQKLTNLPAIRLLSGGPSYEYRNRQRFHRLTSTQLGMYELNSQHGIGIDYCLLMDSPMNRALAMLQAAPAQEAVDSVTLFSDSSRILASFESQDPPRADLVEVGPAGSSLAAPVDVRLRYNVGSFHYSVPPSSFFQVNIAVAAAMLDQIEQWIGPLPKRGLAVDLYAGAGFFSLPLARHFPIVAAVEENPDAVEAARLNAADNQTPNATFFLSSVEPWLRRESHRFVKPEVLCADPPREGLGPKTVELLLAMAPARLAYVSCNPSTLARDLRVLASSYQIEELVVVDLFPQTYHIETMAWLKQI